MKPTRKQREHAQACAAAGASLLDRIRKRWAWEVEPERLELHSLSYCVLGQLYGTYSEGAYRLERRFPRQLSYGSSWSYDYGFDRSYLTRDWDGEFSALNAAWRAEIAKRRESA
jgi:hypothetical protein